MFFTKAHFFLYEIREPIINPFHAWMAFSGCLELVLYGRRELAQQHHDEDPREMLVFGDICDVR